MITEYRIKGSIGIGCGMLCHLVGFMGVNFGAPHAFALCAFWGATAILTYGSVNYLRAKGYSPLIGLAALIPSGFIGLVIACALPDQRREPPGEPPPAASTQGSGAKAPTKKSP